MAAKKNGQGSTCRKTKGGSMARQPKDLAAGVKRQALDMTHLNQGYLEVVRLREKVRRAEARKTLKKMQYSRPRLPQDPG